MLYYKAYSEIGIPFMIPIQLIQISQYYVFLFILKYRKAKKVLVVLRYVINIYSIDILSRTTWSFLSSVGVNQGKQDWNGNKERKLFRDNGKTKKINIKQGI